MTVLSDHKNLTYYRDAQKSNRRQAQWSLFLSEFDVKLVHISRTKMVQSDALSRWPDFTLENDNDNEDITMLPENLFIHLIDTNLQNRIAECKDMDKDTTEALITLLDQKSTSLRTGLEDWTTENFGDKNILFFKGKNYIPKDETLRWDIARMFHDHETAGHPGWINSKSTTATTIQTEINLKKKTLLIEDQIPKEFHKFLDVFSEEKAAWFPEPRQWDHKIEIKDTFIPKSFKTYNLTPQEQIELDKFLKENLEKGYIWPSQSPMASPFFFVDKKDGKVWPCQDYRYLNEHTVKMPIPYP